MYHVVSQISPCAIAALKSVCTEKSGCLFQNLDPTMGIGGCKKGSISNEAAFPLGAASS
jgi:hypothetical protein